MKVRIGVAAGIGAADDPPEFLRLVDALDDLGYDSIWVPDVITTSVFDPIASLGVAAGRRSRLKIGTHLIVPGRNPVLLAKQLATLDQLSAGRLLLLFVLGIRTPAELDAQGVDAGARPAMLEESLQIMRTLWSGGSVSHHGEHHRYDAAQLSVLPAQDPLEVWLGGQVPAALRRAGRLGDGWMPGLCAPDEAQVMRETIEAEARAAGRIADPEHFGMNLSWVDDTIDTTVREAIDRRRPGFDPAHVVGVGPAGLAERIVAFREAGFSKFVVRPALPPQSWPAAVESVSAVLDLQT